MTSTAQLVRPQEKTGTWSSIFPNEQVTEQQSALFVKKLLAVAISNVTYLRAIFPENAFGDRCLEDLNLKILRDDSSCPGACQVIKWVKGCFDALDKKYLRMLVVGIYVDPEDPETVLESYTFKFSYTQEGGIDIYRNNKKISSAFTAAETKKATIRLLRTIVVLTQTLRSLPDDVMMTMKLMYYDDVTPTDYEPPGFKAADSDSFRFDEEPTNIKVGDVATPFHSVKMRIKTDGKQFDIRDAPVEENDQGSQEISNNGLDEELAESQRNAVHPVMETESKESEVPSEKTVTVSNASPAKPNTVMNEDEPMTQASETQEFKVRCPCGCNEDDGLMIMCASCKFWQHGLCFLIVEEDQAPDEHFCDVCATDVQECTDPQLSDLSSIAVQATCLWRRTLQACTEMNRVLAPHLARRLGIEVTVAQGLINRLEKENFVRNPGRGKKLGKVVDKALIRMEAMPKYFKKVDKSNTKIGKTENDTDMENKVEKVEVVVEGRNSSEQEVDELVQQTEGISIDSRKLRSKGKGKASTEAQENQSDKKRGKKRAFSKVDNTNEFDVSASQEAFSENILSRRKKASIVAKAIMV